MNGSLLTYFLFAQMSKWQRMGDGLHRGRGRIDLMELLPYAFAIAVVAIVIVIVVKVRKRNDLSQPCNDPDKLFRELSLAQNLDRTSQKHLWCLAEALQLAQPAEVFIQPVYFQADLPEELHGEEAEFEALHKRLF